jgi:succinate dehydrogenase / fumarate reductase cytochrome b subunit
MFFLVRFLNFFPRKSVIKIVSVASRQNFGDAGESLPGRQISRSAGSFSIRRPQNTTPNFSLRPDMAAATADAIGGNSRTFGTAPALTLQAASIISPHAPFVRADKFSVNIFAAFYRSSVGKKMTVAITGIILILFVIGHLLGNLQIFLGPDWINSYSQHLRDLGPLLWLIRIFLLLTVIIHIYVTIELAIENRRARPDRYIDRQYVKATFASRHMVMSGLIVLAFIIYHLAHFTVRVTDPRFGLLKADPLNRYDVYSMMVYGFQNYLVSGFYVLGLFLLALHLSHGSSSFFQSLGLNDKKLTPRLALGGRIFAWLMFTGYTSIPVAVLLGLIKPAQQL